MVCYENLSYTQHLHHYGVVLETDHDDDTGTCFTGKVSETSEGVSQTYETYGVHHALVWQESVVGCPQSPAPYQAPTRELSQTPSAPWALLLSQRPMSSPACS